MADLLLVFFQITNLVHIMWLNNKPFLDGALPMIATLFNTSMADKATFSVSDKRAH